MLHSFQDVVLTFFLPCDIEEITNGVLNLVTNETMTKYSEIIEVPELCKVWLEAMCIELGGMLQVCGNTKVTDTIKFIIHKEIS